MNRIELPENYIEKMKELLGGEFQNYLDSFDEKSVNGLRVNVGKVSPERLKDMLPYELEKVPWIANGFYYPQEERLSKDVYYYAGLYYLQEPSAMTPASLLPVEPGDMVLDLCAAPGGKSTELGVKLKGQGMLVSNDISNSRAKALLKNLELFGIPNICVTSETPEKLAGIFPEFFDKILVDAPCSGEGMFRRDKDMVKSWLEKGPEYYCEIQKEIMEQAVAMLKPGGYLLYSTCTFDQEEDEGIIGGVLANHPDMELVKLPLFDGAADGFGLSGCIRLFPHRIKGEGHFIALLQKRWSGNAGSFSAAAKRGMAAGISGSMADRIAGRSAAEMPHRTERIPRRQNLRGKEDDLSRFLDMIRLEFDDSRLVEKHGSVYYLPEGFPVNSRLRFLRTGLLMGELKNGRFEPSQALAMVLSPETFSCIVSFGREDGRVVRYLKGETISLTGDEGPVKGWCLVCVDGFALGFAKGTGMALKNKYYPGWRWQ